MCVCVQGHFCAWVSDLTHTHTHTHTHTAGIQVCEGLASVREMLDANVSHQTSVLEAHPAKLHTPDRKGAKACVCVCVCGWLRVWMALQPCASRCNVCMRVCPSACVPTWVPNACAVGQVKGVNGLTALRKAVQSIHVCVRMCVYVRVRVCVPTWVPNACAVGQVKGVNRLAALCQPVNAHVRQMRAVGRAKLLCVCVCGERCVCVCVCVCVCMASVACQAT